MGPQQNSQTFDETPSATIAAALATEKPARVKKKWERDGSETSADTAGEQEEEQRERLGCFTFGHERSAQLLVTD